MYAGTYINQTNVADVKTSTSEYADFDDAFNDLTQGILRNGEVIVIDNTKYRCGIDSDSYFIIPA